MRAPRRAGTRKQALRQQRAPAIKPQANVKPLANVKPPAGHRSAAPRKGVRQTMPPSGNSGGAKGRQAGKRPATAAKHRTEAHGMRVPAKAHAAASPTHSA